MAKKTNSLRPSQMPAPAYQVFLSNPNLEAEYHEREASFDAQAPIIQRFLEMQASQLADSIVHNQPQVRFALPDRVTLLCHNHQREPEDLVVSPQYREQWVGGIFDRITGVSSRDLLKNRLIELEDSKDEAVSTSASLIRHLLARHLVHTLLPSGRSVTYTAPEGEEIPTLPVPDADQPASAITAPTDAITQDGPPDRSRGELLVPFVPAARRFYLPQWVAFDGDGQLLVGSLNEAEANLASMQRFVALLHLAVSLAPYFVFDPLYQTKRYGMLGQLIHQGRQQARYEVKEMIRVIKQRAAAHDLNRGLSLSVPYFDDQSLEMRTHDFVVIPAGRILFVPAFVVQAAREEQVKVAQDTRLSPSTRKYLLEDLQAFEEAFYRQGKHHE